MHSITPELQKYIQETAKKLSKTEIKPVYLTGAELLDKGSLAEIKQAGGIVIPDQTYKILRSTGQAVNHVKRMTAAFEKDGNLGLMKYVRNYLTGDLQKQIDAEIEKLETPKQALVN